MSLHALEGGFANPALDAARAFRAVMEAVARPGTIHLVSGATPPAPLSAAAGAVILTLCDTETPLYLAGDVDCANVRDWIAFHTGAPFTGRAHCMFAVGAWTDLVPLASYPVGNAEYPDRSATLIAELPALSQTGATLQGPGIKSTSQLLLPDKGLLQDNHKLFPLGLDFIFTCGTSLAAMPRSTEVT